MRRWTTAAAFALICGATTCGRAQGPAVQPGDANLPAPGTRGNADNVSYIGNRDPGGNPVRLARATGHVSNYSEDKIPPYTLPDPLVMSNGRRVTTAEMWLTQRRPEILKSYRTEIYGHVPQNAPKVTWEVTETDTAARDGTAIMRRVVGRMGDKPDGPRMNLTVYTPAKANGPVPLLLSITFGFGTGARGGAGKLGQGPATTPGKTEDGNKATPPARGPGGGFDSIGEVLSRGWGYASLGYTDIQPDRADRWTEGVIGLTLKEGQTRPAPDQWGTISAWAWGISRCIDYFETDKTVDAKHIGITGASRLGKTVLWAAAQDERVAAVFSVVSGEMGASLIRRDWGETLDDMAQNFSWQFAGNLQKWVGKWDDLPVDQHMLIALCAPRPVYVNGGLTDQWSDPKGEFLALAAAGPVYRLLGAKDLGVTELPPMDQPVTGGDLAFHYHSSGHTAVPADWKAFLDFADRHFKSTAAK
jgi:(4-O-methyl)-D-glucuronate---lignin esterase